MEENVQNVQNEQNVQNVKGRIAALKQLLAKSDYVALKYAEGRIGNDEYAPVGEKRENIRRIIRELEKEEAEDERDT